MVKNQFANARDAALIPELGRSLGEGNGNPLQCSHLENSMDRGAWQGQEVHGVLHGVMGSMGSGKVRHD